MNDKEKLEEFLKEATELSRKYGMHFIDAFDYLALETGPSRKIASWVWWNGEEYEIDKLTNQIYKEELQES